MKKCDKKFETKKKRLKLTFIRYWWFFGCDDCFYGLKQFLKLKIPQK